MKDEKNFADFLKEIEKADKNGASFDELSGRMEDFMREALKNECPEKLAEFDALQKEADEFVENERANRGKTRKKKHKKKSLICLEFHNLTYQDWRKRSSNA